MKLKFFRFSLFLAAFIGVAVLAQADTLTYNIHVGTGPYGLPNIAGTVHEVEDEYFPPFTHIDATGDFITDTNGNATVVLGSVTFLWFEDTPYSLTVTITPAAGYTFDHTSLGTSGDFSSLNAPAPFNFTFTVQTGPESGQVLSAGLPINGVTVSGSVSGNVPADPATGGFTFSPAPPQSVTATKPGVTFESQTIYPGHPLVLRVLSGPISGNLSGSSNAGHTVRVLGQDGSSASCQTDTNGNYTTPTLDASQTYTISVANIGGGYHFWPNGGVVSGMPAGLSGLNFGMASTPPQFGQIQDITPNENVPSLTVPTPVIYGDVYFGMVALAAASSNTNVIPNTAANLAFTGHPGNQLLVLVPAPGALGSTAITLTLNDHINPPVTTTFKVTINPQPQVPVAGMPVALSDNGTNSRVVVPGFGAYAPTSEITIEFWQKVASVQTQSTFMLAPDDAHNRINASVPWTGGAYGTVFWDFGDIGGSGRLSAQLPNDITGKWTHFALVASQTDNDGNGGMQIYMNGQLLAAKVGSGTFQPVNADLVLAGPPYAGGLSEFRVWNVARTGSQILQSMNNPLVGDEPGLVAYYRFNENSGITIHDSSPGRHDAGIVGDAPYPSWVPAPTNFPYYVVRSFSSNNVMYLPGYVQDHPPADLVWEIVTNDNLHGTLTQVGSGGEWFYTPDPAFPGGDAGFTYAVSTGLGTLTNFANVFIHVAPLNPPILSAIGSQLTEENTPTPPILFTIFDTNTPISQLSLSVVGDNAGLVDPNSGFRLTTLTNLGDTNAMMALVITPLSGAIGSANVTLSANDGHNLASETFVLQVNQKPAYTIVDLGLLPNRFASYATAINNQGQVVGYATDGSPGQNLKEAFLYTGFGAGGQLVPISLGANLPSAAYAIDDLGKVTGTAVTGSGFSQIFYYDSASMALSSFGALGTNSLGSLSLGLGINDNGTVVGSSMTGAAGRMDAFESAVGLSDLGLGSPSVAAGINNAGQMVGYAVYNGATNAFLITPIATNNAPAGTNYLGFLPGGTNSLALAINQSGDLVGAGSVGSGFTHAWLQISGSGTLTDLGTVPGTSNSVAYGLNAFRQIVGSAVGVGGFTRAFLYSSGQIHDLNDLIPYEETNAWELLAARAINDQGAIAGSGRFNGVDHAFLALPAQVIGKPIPRPLGTVEQIPGIDILAGTSPDDSAANAFFWNVPEKRLYAIRPVTARLHWPTGAGLVPGSTNIPPTVDVTSKNVWPRQAQTHVANSPVQVEPQGAPAGSFNYSFSAILYSTVTAANVDPNSKVLSATIPGYTVLRYFVTSPGVPIDPINSPCLLQVVRTVNWNDPDYLADNVPWAIGSAITNATHFDYAGRNGFVYFAKSVYDGLPGDPNRAYDRPTRAGPIIPVNVPNKSLPVPDDDLVVAWYHTNSLGVAWPDAPCRYLVQWPAASDPTNTIVIASQLGSGANGLPAWYLQPQVYVQNDPTQPGFNPNEEHAFIAGGVLYALRNDLNHKLGELSQPFALLKYQDATASNQWTMRLFQVVATNNQYQFLYSGTAGEEIQPPVPLGFLPLCTSFSRGVSGPFYQAAVNGHLYARAAGPYGQHTNIVLQYWYPLQPDFYLPNAAPGTCVPWLDWGSGTPVNVSYDIAWPNQYVMQVGQTLTTPAFGLPDITDLLNATIIYDDLSSTGTWTPTNLARLYDPFTPRSVPVPPNASWLSSLKLNNVNGVSQFADLPWYLRIRLTYDPINQLLSFAGQMPEPTPGADPILLCNVMSLREREMIKQLDGGTGTTDFDRLIDQLYKLTRNPNMLTLNPPGVNPNLYDDAVLIGLTAVTNADGSISIVPQTFGSGQKALTTGLFGVPPATIPGGFTNYPPRYVTVVQDDPTTPGSTVQMYVIQVDNGPFLGALAPMPGDNVFDQRLTLRYTADLGGDPNPLQFEWYYYPGDNGGVSPPLPTLNADGSVQNYNGWLSYMVPDVLTETQGRGANDITLGLGGESGLLTMSDNWFVSRYRGYGIDGATNWSGWVGQPGGGAGQLVVGWVNRVLAGLNPFDARSSDFHTSPIDTYQTMLEQAGPRYEGPIALNADPNYINSVGLIQAYQTVLEIGESLSVNGTPPVNYEPANQALLDAASRISDFYVLFGNEAYAEASDPTIGFSTSSTQFGSLASSIFAFEDQVDTLLDQELMLLRGRDDTATTVRAAPVYNRLYWNFTGGNGEVAYVQTFDITDVNNDGFINAADAMIMFPQGHGDAWGHYLTALTVYYDLLRNPNYDWVARPEAVSLGGVAVQVNYEDERKFAHAAAAKAQTGADIMNLTYRSAYVDDPNGQYQGYKDTDTTRAWGLSEWARRAGQGAYFDWVTVNALLPAADTNAADTGLAKVDRTTVADIGLIPTAYASIQDQLDKADAGLNPLGLAKQSVPFDIDPSQIDLGKTHFEQIYDRAVSAMVNAAAVWDQANQFSSALRQQQDTVNNFSQNITKEDQDFKDRLIETFGYPYAGDIGTPSGAYPAGYDGPDLYHYMYFDTSTFDQGVAGPSEVLTGFFSAMPNAGQYFSADLPSTYSQPTNVLQISFPLADATHKFQPPATWGQRRAPGEIQMALSDLLQSQGRLDQAIDSYSALIQQIEDSATLLQDHYGLNATNQQIQDSTDNTVLGLEIGIGASKLVAAGLQAAVSTLKTTEDITVSGIPGVEGLAVDALAGVRASVKTVFTLGRVSLEVGEAAADGAAQGMQAAITGLQASTAKTIANNNLDYEMQQQLSALEELIRQEPAARAECYTLRETLAQNLGRYQSALASGQSVLEQRANFAKQAAAQTESYRYEDMTFRIFRNDAIQKYKAQFDLAQRYVFLAAIAYDYETELLGSASGSGQQFLTDIIRQQSLGEMDGGQPVNGVAGLADPLARLDQNFAVLKGQLGFNNPQTETGKFSLRYGLFRQQAGLTNALPINGVFTNDWQTELENHIVPDLWQIPEFRRYCRPFAPESAGPQPGLVIGFGTTITYGLNFFGWPLSGGDSAYDPTLFATKVRSSGAWFAGYDQSGLSVTPRVYLIPVGMDVLRSPTGSNLDTRQWRVIDQALPVPFPLGASTMSQASYIPMNDSLSGTLEDIRRISSFPAYVDQGTTIDPSQVTTDSRLIGRSVWNTEWMLIIPGGTLLNDPNQGLNAFVNSVSDIKIFFHTYSYSGD
jgi:probable HAF family extracellular repeat protein